MPPARPLLILAGAPVGLAVGALAWALFVGGRPTSHRLDALEQRVAAIRPETPRRVGSGPADRTAQIVGSPLFALTTGPGAVAEVAVKLLGLARSRAHTAALISIDNKPAEWLELGATRDGVTLREVLDSRIVIDTAMGFREISLGDPAPGR